MPLFYHCTLFSQEVYYIIERCEVNKTFIQPSGALYQDYREYSKSIGEPPRSNASFNKALAEKGFKKQKNGRGSFIYGLRLLDEAPACQIPFISASQVMGSDGENQESDDSEIEFKSYDFLKMTVIHRHK